MDGCFSSLVGKTVFSKVAPEFYDARPPKPARDPKLKSTGSFVASLLRMTG
jgi:hypothetical protein